MIPFLKADPCITCLCQNSTINCFKDACPQGHNCYYQQTNSSSYCCSKCKGCSFNGKYLANGETAQDDGDPCLSYQCNVSVCYPYQFLYISSFPTRSRLSVRRDDHPSKPVLRSLQQCSVTARPVLSLLYHLSLVERQRRSGSGDCCRKEGPLHSVSLFQRAAHLHAPGLSGAALSQVELDATVALVLSSVQRQKGRPKVAAARWWFMLARRQDLPA